jgi:integrase
MTPGVSSPIYRLRRRKRHSFAVKYLIAGGDVMSLKRMLGHTSLAVTQVYLHLADSHIATQHAKFSPVDKLGLGNSRRNGRGRANAAK